MGRGGNLIIALLLAMLMMLSPLGLGRNAAQGEQRNAYCNPPYVKNPPSPMVIPEGGSDSTLELNFTGHNNGVFTDDDFKEDWGEVLTFSFDPNPDFHISIDNNDPSAPATIRPNRDWNGEANLTFTATDLYGKSNSTVVHVSVTPVEDPPFVQAKIPDFTINEGHTNLTMRDIPLFNVFGDPDFPPFGDDNLTFKVDNSSFPSVIVDSKLTFGEAPRFPDKMNHKVVVIITAMDKAGMMVTTQVNITVIYINHSPWYDYCKNWLEMDENTVYCLDLNTLFMDQDNDPLNFFYLGGASANLAVEIAPNGTAVLTPAPGYFTDPEVLRFEAIDPLGANCTGELMVNIRECLRPPHPLAGSLVPDPRDVLFINETDAFTFRVAAVDFDGCQSELRFTWFVDNVQKTLPGVPSFVWEPTFDDAGPHVVKVRVSHGVDYFDERWNVSVQNVDRPPVITEVWPLDNTGLGYDGSVTFNASAYDPDGDQLTFHWRLPDGTLLWNDSGKNTSAFSKYLAPGTHIIVLEVKDGQGGIARQFICVRVPSEPPASPEIQLAWSAFCAAAIVLTAATASFWRRTRR